MIHSSSNKRWHYFLQRCHKKIFGQCFQFRYRWSHWLGCVSVPYGTGFQATSAVVTLQNILIYLQILQNSHHYSLSKLSLIISLQPIPQHKWKWSNIKTYAIFFFLSRHHLSSPGLYYLKRWFMFRGMFWTFPKLFFLTLARKYRYSANKSIWENPSAQKRRGIGCDGKLKPTRPKLPNCYRKPPYW